MVGRSGLVLWTVCILSHIWDGLGSKGCSWGGWYFCWGWVWPSRRVVAKEGEGAFVTGLPPGPSLLDCWQIQSRMQKYKHTTHPLMIARSNEHTGQHHPLVISFCSRVLFDSFFSEILRLSWCFEQWSGWSDIFEIYHTIKLFHFYQKLLLENVKKAFPPVEWLWRKHQKCI